MASCYTPPTVYQEEATGILEVSTIPEISFRLLCHTKKRKYCVTDHLRTGVHVTSFSSLPYYSNMRLISKMYSEQNSHSITLDIHASTVERPLTQILLSFSSTHVYIFFSTQGEIAVPV